MKTLNYANELSMILDITKRSGMTLASLSKELKVGTSTLRSWRLGRHYPDNPGETIKAIKNRAKYLSRIDLDSYDINNLKDDFGITFESLAEELETSRQWISRNAKNNFEDAPELRSQVQEVLRGIGRRWQSAIK